MIDLAEFERKAAECFEEIPAEFRERVEGPVVVERAKRHRRVRGMYVLGECHHAPDWTASGELLSTVVLYYGSFAACARRDPDFDVEEEIRETVRHEVQHHVEDRVGAKRLRDLDWAVEQDSLRREGRRFTPRYWRAGERLGRRGDLWAVGGDVFLELELPPSEWRRARREGMEFEWDEEVCEILAGEIQEDEEIFEFEGLGRSEHGSAPGDLVVVVRRVHPLLGALRRARRP